MSDRAYSILNEHYEGYNGYMSKFKDDYDGNNIELTKRLSQDIEILIINNQINNKEYNKELSCND